MGLLLRALVLLFLAGSGYLYYLRSKFMLIIEKDDGLHNEYQCDTNEEERQKLFTSVNSELEGRGFRIDDGILTFRKMDYGNPSTVYGAFRNLERNIPWWVCLRNEKVCRGVMLFEEKDTLVWLGCTPPKAKHYHIAPYMFVRTNPVFVPGVEIHPPHNRVTMQCSDNNQGCFDTTVVYIFGGDQNTIDAVKETYIKKGFPEGSINVATMPAELIRFRHSEQFLLMDRPDILQVLWRFTFPENREDADRFIAKGWRAHIIRSADAEAVVPTTSPLVMSYGKGKDEKVLQASFDSLVQSTIHMVEKNYNAKFVRQIGSSAFFPDFPTCFDKDYDPAKSVRPAEVTSTVSSCARVTGDHLLTTVEENANWDHLKLDSTTLFVQVGVHHANFGKVLYFNAKMTQAVPGTASASYERTENIALFTDTELQGSAADVDPTNPDAENLFVLKYGGHGACHTADRFCKEPEDVFDNGWAAFWNRLYVDPLTGTRPNPEEIILPAFLQFKLDAPSNPERAKKAEL